VVPKTPNGPQAIDNQCCSNRNRGSGVKQDQRTKTIPIIAVTALASPEYEKKGLESGCDAYIPKPITLGNFLRTIELVLKIRPVTPTSFTSLSSPDGLMHSALASSSART